MPGVTGLEWGVQVFRPVTVAEAAALRDAGLGRITAQIPWRWLEPRPGAWDTETIDHFLAPLREAGLALQAVLGPAMPHLLPVGQGADVPGFVPRFATFCAEAAARLPDVTVFRVEDELNAAFAWEVLRTRRRRGRAWLRPAFRLDLLLAATAAVRAARPDAELRVTVRASLPGWRRELRTWLDAGLRPGRLGLAFGLPRLLPRPAQGARIGDVVAAARLLLDRAGAADVPVEIARIGYQTRGRGFTPRAQREFLVEAASAVARAGASGFHWWSLHDQAWDDPVLGYWTPSRELHSGLLSFDSTPKPAMEELRVLATGRRC